MNGDVFLSSCNRLQHLTGSMDPEAWFQKLVLVTSGELKASITA